MSEAPDPEVVELATKVFDLARQGQTEALVAYVDAGVPANLTNDRGDSLVMLAAYHGHADAVRALLAPRRRRRPGQRPGPDPARRGRLQGRGGRHPGPSGGRRRPGGGHALGRRHRADVRQDGTAGAVRRALSRTP